MNSTNPVLSRISKVGLSATAFCVLYNCSMASMRNVIYGNCDIVPAAIKAGLNKAGFETANIDTEYKDWLKEKVQKELEAGQYVKA